MGKRSKGFGVREAGAFGVGVDESRRRRKAVRSVCRGQNRFCFFAISLLTDNYRHPGRSRCKLRAGA